MLIKPRNIFLRDVTLVSIAQVISGASFFCYTLIVARSLSIPDYGLFQAIMALYGTIAFFHLPLSFGAVHCVGAATQEESRNVLGEFIKISGFFGAVTALLVVLISPWLVSGFHADSSMLFIILALLVFTRPVLSSIYGGMQGKRLYSVFTTAKIIESILCLLFGLLLLVLGAKVPGALAGYLISTVVILLFFVKTRNHYHFVPGFTRVREEFYALRWILLSFLVLMVVDNAPIIIGRSKLSLELSGFYGALYNLRNMVLPFAFAVIVPFYSRMASTHNESYILLKALTMVSLLAVAFIFLGFFCSELIFKILYGSGFVEASIHMVRYGFSLWLQMLAMVIMFYQIAIKRKAFVVLLVPVVVLIVHILSQEINISGLISAQIVAWGAYLMVTLTWQFVPMVTKDKTIKKHD